MTISPDAGLSALVSPNVLTISEALTRLGEPDGATSPTFERSPRAYAFDGSNLVPAMAFASGIEQLERRGVRVFDGMNLAAVCETGGARELAKDIDVILKVLSQKTDVVISR